MPMSTRQGWDLDGGPLSGKQERFLEPSLGTGRVASAVSRLTVKFLHIGER